MSAITYTISESEFALFCKYYMEPGRLYKYPALYAMAYLKQSDIDKLKSTIIPPFTKADVTIENNTVTYIAVYK